TDRLVCVRYRYDAQQKKRFKTVEIIVAEREWDPPAPRFTADTIVGVRVGFAEADLRDRVKQAVGSGTATARCGTCAMIRSSRSSWKPGSSMRKHLILDTKTKRAKHLYADALWVSTARCLSLYVDASIQ